MKILSTRIVLFLSYFAWFMQIKPWPFFSNLSLECPFALMVYWYLGTLIKQNLDLCNIFIRMFPISQIFRLLAPNLSQLFKRRVNRHLAEHFIQWLNRLHTQWATMCLVSCLRTLQQAAQLGNWTTDFSHLDSCPTHWATAALHYEYSCNPFFHTI